MKPANAVVQPVDDAADAAVAPDGAAPRPSMGSEYMDARSYLTQPVRAPRVRESGPDYHGSNESSFGATRITADHDPE